MYTERGTKSPREREIKNMDFRMDTYIGNEHYWIRFKNGTHEVRHATSEDCPDNETVFTGHYEKCVEWIKEAVNADLENRW